MQWWIDIVKQIIFIPLAFKPERDIVMALSFCSLSIWSSHLKTSSPFVLKLILKCALVDLHVYCKLQVRTSNLLP